MDELFEVRALDVPITLLNACRLAQRGSEEFRVQRLGTPAQKPI